MISLDDIVGMTDLTEEEVAAIGAHKHLDLAPAAALADYMLHQHHGAAHVQAMICDDIRDALHRDDLAEARALFAAPLHDDTPGCGACRLTPTRTGCQQAYGKRMSVCAGRRRPARSARQVGTTPDDRVGWVVSPTIARRE